MAVIGVHEIHLVPSLKGGQSAIGRELDKAAGPAGERAGRTMGSRLGGALKLGAAGAGGAAIAGLGVALTKGFGRLTQIENAQAKLAGLGHSADSVKRIMTNATDAVKGTAFGLGDAATVAAGAVASGVKPGQELERTLKLTADAATIANVPMSEMGAIFNKVSSTGKIQGEVLAQLGERGIPILQLLGESLGKTPAEVQKLASEGKIGFEQFQAAMEQGMGGAALKSGETLQGAFANSLAAIGRFGANLIKDVYPQVQSFFTGFIEWMGPVEELGTVIGQHLGGALSAMSGWITGTALPALQQFGGWVRENKDPIMFAAAAIGGMVAGFALYRGVVGVIGFIQGVAGAIGLMNAAMAANPIMLVVIAIGALVGAAIWAYNNIEWFRNGVQLAWAGIQHSMSWAWQNVIKPVFDALSGFVRNVLGPIFVWLWESVISPVFTWIGNFVRESYEQRLRPALDALRSFIQDVLGPAVSWLWDSVIKPVFGWIGERIKNVWQGIIQPTLQLFWDFIKNILAPIVTAFWESHVKPAFEKIGSFIRDTWNNVIKPILEAFGRFIGDHVVPGIRKAVDWIGDIWAGLKKMFADPINWVIRTVWNNGIVKAFENVAKSVGSDARLGTIPEIATGDAESKRQNRAGTGGVTTQGRFHTGGYTGNGGKYQKAGDVHGGEYVIKKESTAKLRKSIGLKGLDWMNQTGEFPPGYWSGGYVQPVSGPMTSGFGASRGKWPHAGVDWAVPIGTAVKAAMAGVVERMGTNIVTGRTGKGVLLGHEGGKKSYYGHLDSFIARVGESVRAGQVFARSGNTGKSTGPHLHFETWQNGKAVNPLTGKGGLDTGDSDGGGGFDFLAPLRDFVSGAAEKVLGHLGDNPNAKLMAGFIGKLGSEALEGAGRVIQSIGDFMGPQSGGLFDINAGTKSQVRSVAKGYGWDQGDMWSALHELVNRESSWRLNAANPTSSARGLFQKMTSYHGEVEKTAGDQAGWGLNYIRERYGNPMNALAFHNRNGHYADGGLVADHHLFRDRGGNLPPGLSMVLNRTGRDEMVLTDRQWRDIHALASRSAGSAGNTYYLPPVQHATTDDLVQTLEFYDLRASRV